jgi:hypothetical protein
MQGLLGEMSVYPVGLMLVVIAAADLVRQPALETLYPAAAILGGLIAGLVVLLANAGGQSNAEIEHGQPALAAKSVRSFRTPMVNFLALLAARQPTTASYQGDSDQCPKQPGRLLDPGRPAWPAPRSS